MTERIYYTDPSRRTFDAVVRACDVVDGRPHVVLDRTAFYPTSGGQPFDTGRLGGADVLAVIDRDDDEVAHVVSAPLPVGSRVQGEVDWPRRLDHMQQHSGQHVLSAAFEATARAATVSVHLGTDVSTIDLAREVSAAEIEAAETWANGAVWDDREVTIRFVGADEAERLPLRKAPARTGELRLIEIDGVDVSACGGTHVPRTGVIGLIAITGSERSRGVTRVSFVCGGRALRSHRALRGVVLAATRALSVTPGDVTAAIDRLQTEARDAERRLADLQRHLSVYRAGVLKGAAEMVREFRLVLGIEPGADSAALKTIAAHVVAEPGLVVALAGEGQPLPIVVARSADVAVDCAAVLRRITGQFGGRGGGRADIAQGGVPAPADAVLAAVRGALLS
jgi:alanyl-tRNA synthetase